MVQLTIWPILLPEGHPSSGPPYVTLYCRVAYRDTATLGGPPRDTATLGGIGSAFPATQILPNYSD